MTPCCQDMISVLLLTFYNFLKQLILRSETEWGLSCSRVAAFSSSRLPAFATFLPDASVLRPWREFLTFSHLSYTLSSDL